MKDFLALVIFVLISQGAGLLGSFFTASAIDSWYASLVLPAVAPPNWVFGPVWTLLYLFMGIALWLVWRKRAEKKTYLAYSLFGIQLILNTLWSYIFFGLQNPAAAFIEIIILWIAILGTVVVFTKASRTAGILLAPYLLWVTFAAYLNLQIWQLN
ncbi:MAG TPA: TspO/MBR family protein [Candidatus Paceibacterota bacterium]|nr:TspO/MBR family protein [Candidatus Paceibacterota bacterium]